MTVVVLSAEYLSADQKSTLTDGMAAMRLVYAGAYLSGQTGEKSSKQPLKAVARDVVVGGPPTPASR
jgi:hypothetical protein